ncbi:uncharacterized protein LOC119329241 [Triticum dicoccoides]|uniref:uncharacterized protein LOC119329241 n=1 Tax=Triticum dicoccoides TaxID=85692 RepID=UPI00189121FA|nr:uncharacterized protein LOC119329241 [Triticum dicoccoides]
MELPSLPWSASRSFFPSPQHLAASVDLLCVSNRPKIPTLSSSPTMSSATRSDTASSAPFGSMPFKRFVLIGWVALVNYGKDYGCLVVIVDVVDQNRNVEDTVHREVEIMQHLSGHPAVVTLKAVCGGCKLKQLKGTRRLGVRDYISLLSLIFCPKYKEDVWVLVKCKLYYCEKVY